MIGAIVFGVLAIASASPSVTGQVRDSTTHAPVAGALVIDVASHVQTRTDAGGRFTLPERAPVRIRVSEPHYASRELDVVADSGTVVDLAPAAHALERVTVTALRAGGDAPISEHTVRQDEIERRYAGQEVPLVLQSAPAMTAYDETATYWGYSYMRLRGIDQSRINLTLDGIPLNDPEDEVLYFADFPDLANSIRSAQIQRGVGTSALGTSAFAGSINFESIPIASSQQGGEVQLEGGSFGAKRASLEYATGLHGRFAAYGRVSALQENGYRYHSGVLGRSAFLSAGYFGDRDIVKLTATAGLLRDTLAYLAVPDSELRTDRRLNPLQPDELDRFGEQLVGLTYTRLLGEASSWSTTLYRISSKGNYDVFLDPGLENFHLDFAWYGATTVWTFTRGALKGSFGANANTYARDHYAFMRPDLANALYRNTGRKRDASAFAKVAYGIGGDALTLFGDVQGRWAEWQYVPDANADVPGGRIDWRFLNPKVGATWRITRPVSAYVSYGVNGREPARSDILAGFDNLDTSNVAFVGSFARVRPEHVRDLESGVDVRATAFDLRADVYAMEFRNEILPIGQLSYIGTPLRKNVPSSHRRGVELDGEWRALPRLTLGGNAAFNWSRIAEYTDDASGQTYRDVTPLLTPRVLFNQRADLALTRRVRIALDGRYQSRSNLDNTGDTRFVLPSSYLLDGTVGWRIGRSELAVNVNNLTGAKAFGSGYDDGTTSYYYVVPPRNVLVTARIAF